jgi:hypothetical protein
VNGPTLNPNSDLSVNSQSQENSQFRTNTTTYYNMDLNRAQREPSVIPMTRAGQHQQQRIDKQTVSSLSSYKSISSSITQNPITEIDGNCSTLQNSQPGFNNNNKKQFVCPQQNSQVQNERRTDSQSINNIGLHQSSVQDRSQQVRLQLNTPIHIISQNNELHSSSDTDEHGQEPIIYTNNQGIIVNPAVQKIIITKNEREEHKPSYPSNGYIPNMNHISVPSQVPQVSTHETQIQSREQFSRQPKQQAYFQQQQEQCIQKQHSKQQYQTQLQMNTNGFNVQQNQNLQAINSQRISNEHEYIGKNATDITRNNMGVYVTSGNTNNSTLALPSNTRDPTDMIMTSNQFQSGQIQQLQPVFPNNQNVMSNRVVSIPQTQQKIISHNDTNLYLPCTPTQITFDSTHLPPVQQIKIKQEKMDISPMKEPYFIDLTVDDNNSIEFDFKPTQVPVSHVQQAQPNLINRSQFARSIVPQLHLQSVNSDQSIDASASLSRSVQNTSSSVIPQNTRLLHGGLQSLRNQPLSTIQPLNDLSESSIQRQNVSLPEDDAELQDWIVNILKDQNFPQFVSNKFFLYTF